VDLVITSDRIEQTNIHFEPLFDYQALAILANDHPLAEKPWLTANDFSQETLITYPVDQTRLDIFNYFLTPNNVSPKQIRQSELTAMILQLVASRRGIAVLPNWVLDDYIARHYVTAKQLGETGLHGTLFAAIRQREANQDYLKDFLKIARDGLSLIRSSTDS
jgi:LysR family transcriptional regulator for metE and metH